MEKHSSRSFHPSQFLKPPKKIIKLSKKPKPYNLQRIHMLTNGFNDSHGSFWSRGPLLGKGAFGFVFLAHINNNVFVSSHSNQLLLSGAQIAIKSSFLEHSSSLQFEKKVFDDLKLCPNVVQCYGHEITKTNAAAKQVYNLLLEYCCEGSLYDRIAKLGPNGLPKLEVRGYTRDIVRGLAYIHGEKYIHCDIKPGNILLKPSIDDGGCLVAKIADFGLARKMSNVKTIDEDEIRGTPLYIVLESQRDSYIDWPVDIWALGCVVLEMLIGKRLWSSINCDPHQLVNIRLHTKKPSKILNNLSPVAIDFLRKCLLPNPYKRWPPTC